MVPASRSSRPRVSPAMKHWTVELLVQPDNVVDSSSILSLLPLSLSLLVPLCISLMPRSHKRRAVLRTVTRQFRHLTRRVLAGFSRLTSMQCLCLRPCRPQRALLLANAPTRSPLVHSSSAFLRLSSSPRRPTFRTERRLLRGLTASTSSSFPYDQVAQRLVNPFATETLLLHQMFVEQRQNPFSRKVTEISEIDRPTSLECRFIEMREIFLQLKAKNLE